MSARPSDALIALRLAVGDASVARDVAVWDDDAWRRASVVLRTNVVLLRAADHARALGVAGAALLAEADAERSRVAAVLAVVARLSDALDAAGLAFVLPKALQHLPDMGHDVDVLVAAGADRADDVVVRALGADPVRGSIVARFAGKRSYDASGVPVETHHGRVGHLGEHAALARALLARRVRVPLAGSATWVPAAEDQLLLQAVQRVAGHRRIRTSDLLRMRELERAGLDEAYLGRTARRLGIVATLRWYRGSTAAAGATAGHAVPLAVTLRAYAEAAVAAARAAEIGSVARIACGPALAATTLMARAARGRAP